MVRKREDLQTTFIQHPALYPSGPLITQLGKPTGEVLWANFAPAPQSTCAGEQVDAFEECVLNGHPLKRSVPEYIDTIVVNDLSFWILYCGLQRVYGELVQLSKDYKIVCSVACGSMDPETHDTVSLLADVMISLEAEKDSPLRGVYHEIVRRATGRTERKRQQYTLSSPDCRIQVRKPTEKTALPEPDPKTHAVTFEMGLSEKEKSARAATTLPHVAARTQGSVESVGQIHYVPDEVDDWDDEDPDDDLDI